MRAYLFDMKNVEYLCERFEKEILRIFFASGQSETPSDNQYFYTPIFQQLFNPIEHAFDACGVFNIEPIVKNKVFVEERFYGLKDTSLPRDSFKMLINDVKMAFSKQKKK